MTTATAPRIARHLFKCPCKNVWKVESDRLTVDAVTWHHLNNTRQACPACKRYAVYGRLVEGTYNAGKSCNARCMGATSGACDCQCAGENHGAAH